MANLQAAVDSYVQQFQNDIETPLFSFLCTLYVSKQKIGNGVIQILKNKETGICRVLMRMNKTYEILLNHFITLDLCLSPIEIRWIANDYSNYPKEKEPIKKDILLQFPRQGNISDDFKKAFKEAHLLADKEINKEYNTTIFNKLSEIIKNTENNKDNEAYDNALVAGLLYYISYDEFFDLPLNVIERVLNKNKSTKFDEFAARRIMMLSKRKYGDKAICIENTECISAPFAYKLELINECMKLINTEKEEIEFSGLGTCELKGDVEFNGECVVFITKNENDYQMLFISTQEKRIVEQHKVEETHNVFPNYPEWTANNVSFLIKFDSFKNDTLQQFYSAQYKAKYNIR